MFANYKATWLQSTQTYTKGMTAPTTTRLSSRESAAGSVHRQDSTCPNPPMPQSGNVPVENFL